MGVCVDESLRMALNSQSSRLSLLRRWDYRYPIPQQSLHIHRDSASRSPDPWRTLKVRLLSTRCSRAGCVHLTVADSMHWADMRTEALFVRDCILFLWGPLQAWALAGPEGESSVPQAAISVNSDLPVLLHGTPVWPHPSLLPLYCPMCLLYTQCRWLSGPSRPVTPADLCTLQAPKLRGLTSSFL